MPGISGGGTTKVEQSARPLTPQEQNLLTGERKAQISQLWTSKQAQQAIGSAIKQAGLPGPAMERFKQALQSELRQAMGRTDLTSAGDRGLAQLGTMARHQTPLMAAQTGGWMRDVGEDPSLTGQQRRDIRRAADLAIASGRSDIETGFREGLTDIRNILAPKRGLRPSDTPIIDRAGDLFKERMRQEGQLIRGVRGQAAQQRLDYPLAAFQAGTTRRGVDISGLGQQWQQAMGTAQALGAQGGEVRANRMALQEALGRLPIQLQTQRAQVAAGIPSVAPALGALTRMQGSSTTRQPGNWQTAMSNIGTLATLGGLMLSDPRLKEACRTTSKSTKEGTIEGGALNLEKGDPAAPREALRMIEKMPAHKYKWTEEAQLELGMDDREHIGTDAKSFQEATGVGDGTTIPMTEGLQLALTALKGVAADVRELKRKRGLGLTKPRRK